MTTQELIQYWVDISCEDLEVAGAMFEQKYYTYAVFMCHQAVEKIFKGLFCKLKEEIPPYTHSLITLANRCNFYDDLTEQQKQFINELEPLNIRTRYPDYKRRISQTLNFDKCKYIYEQTKLLHQWTKEKLS
jgi:HEPN domain-containing protein